MSGQTTSPRQPLAPFLLFGAGGIFFLSAFSIAFWIDGGPKPSVAFLQFEPGTVDFGEVAPQTLSGNATVLNTSKEPLRLLAVNKSCSCTDAQIKAGILRPGEKRDLSFRWDTRGRDGETGILIGVVYAFEGDSTERIAFLTVKATILSEPVQQN